MSVRSLRLHLIALTFYGLLAFILLYAIIFNSGLKAPGFDYFNYNWNFWWTRHALTTPGLSIYESNFVFFPTDNNLGYHALTLQHGAEPNAKVVKDVLAMVHDKGQGTGPRDEVGQVLYMRGLVSAMLGVEGVRRAQERFGKGKVMTGEQTRWGLENLALDQKKLDDLGFAGVMRPISTSCADHRGATWARVHTWDGAKWNFTSDWYQSDETIIKSMIRSAADKYAAEKKLQRRTPADCQS